MMIADCARVTTDHEEGQEEEPQKLESKEDKNGKVKGGVPMYQKLHSTNDVIWTI